MQKIKIIETYVKKVLQKGEVGHDFSHIDRVRNWALKIARAEKYPHLEIIEAAALLHDIGLSFGPRCLHGVNGAQAAEKFLNQKKLFSPLERALICEAVRWHNSQIPNASLVVQIIRDADMLDGSGVMGVARACMHKYFMPLYCKKYPKGIAWDKGPAYFQKLFAQHQDPGETVLDIINFQISCKTVFNTKYARKVNQCLVKRARRFILELEQEIKQKI